MAEFNVRAIVKWGYSEISEFLIGVNALGAKFRWLSLVVFLQIKMMEKQRSILFILAEIQLRAYD